jgi:hypothetical protein
MEMGANDPAATLGDLFRKRHPGFAPKRMVGLLFARPDTDFVKRQLLPDLDDLHLRSGDHVDFFCMGFSNARPGAPPSIEWRFDQEAFVEALHAVEEQCGWSYRSGQCDLLLVAAARPEDGAPGADGFDFSRVVAFDLPRMIADETIVGVTDLLEAIIQDGQALDSLDSVIKFAGRVWKNGVHFTVIERHRD